MYRSPAIEAYVDYGQDPWRVGDSTAVAQRNTSSARKPVAGTIAQDPNGIALNSLPYPYPNTVDGYEQAGVELRSPLRTTQDNIDKGEALYTRYCLHCHGEAGDGMGKIAQNEKIVGIPAYDGKLADLPVGKMYHTLTYGKGLMGSHASQLSPMERWEVIEYVKVLQGTSVIAEDGAEDPALVEAMHDAAAADHTNESPN
jgi:mono/diheme cytochrome c family protein